MPARFAELGDVHADMDEHRFSLDALLELARRDEHDHGLGDLPYPPEYPKMPGEPKRVQPSRAKKNPAPAPAPDSAAGPASDGP
jgi:hypothetical protein